MSKKQKMFVNGIEMVTFAEKWLVNRAVRIIEESQPIKIDSRSLVEISQDPECFDIDLQSSSQRNLVVYSSDLDGVRLFESDLFKSRHYACQKAFDLVVAAVDGTRCRRCHLIDRETVVYCKTCKKFMDADLQRTFWKYRKVNIRLKEAWL